MVNLVPISSPHRLGLDASRRDRQKELPATHGPGSDNQAFTGNAHLRYVLSRFRTPTRAKFRGKCPGGDATRSKHHGVSRIDKYARGEMHDSRRDLRADLSFLVFGASVRFLWDPKMNLGRLLR